MTVARRDDGVSRSLSPSLPTPGFSIKFIEPRQFVVLDVFGDAGTTIEVFDETGLLGSATLKYSGRQRVIVPVERLASQAMQIRLTSTTAPFRLYQS
jgi:hypothetical protein